MENKSEDKSKKKLILPIISVGLVFGGALIYYLVSLIAIFTPVGFYIHTWFLLFAVFSGLLLPPMGVLTGIVALCLGKKRIGKLGMILSAVAVIVPIAFVCTVIMLASRGAIAIGM
jgi:hypothetical protein